MKTEETRSVRARKPHGMAVCLVVVLAMAIHPACAESSAERDQRMQWFREARFGMFIHWGLYAIPAGQWNGKPYEGIAEWIQSMARIPVKEYEMLKDQFNPAKYDPDQWVRMAKDAGMKYVVITSKHHDGFGLWDSAQTDWDIGSTPYGKDLLKPLAEACRKHGLRFCIYHSIMDWHHPDWGTREPWRGNAPNPSPDMDDYTAFMKAQLRELLTGYGDVGVLWFDGEWEDAWTHRRGRDLDDYVRSLQPGIIINNRVDKGRHGMEGFTKEERFRGDFGTPEQQIPVNGIPGADWESCMTMNGSWGYSKVDQNWKTATDLIRNLVDIASKGGNYLLNVGPTAEGEIPRPSVERLRAIGQWMDTNAESIHGTSANPFPETPWGRCTTRPCKGGTRLYLHVFDWPADGKLVLPSLQNPIINARVLADPAATVGIRGHELLLPAKAPDPVASVVVVEIEGKPSFGVLETR